MLPPLNPDDCPADYWSDTQRPLASLLFLAPLLIGYEAAVIRLGDAAGAGLRNGADAWMRGWLLQSGLQFPWVLPLAVAGGLLAWHYRRRDSWTCQVSTLGGMLGESLMFALLLIIGGQTLHQALGAAPVPAALGGEELAALRLRTISYVGAGLYEEALFRLMLLPALYGGFRLLRISRRTSGVAAVVVSSLVFALAHYLPAEASAMSPSAYLAAGDAVLRNHSQWYGFTFRGLAGVMFGVLFVARGFGVTVGSHALYDVLVGLLGVLAR